MEMEVQVRGFEQAEDVPRQYAAEMAKVGFVVILSTSPHTVPGTSWEMGGFRFTSVERATWGDLLQGVFRTMPLHRFLAFLALAAPPPDSHTILKITAVDLTPDEPTDGSSVEELADMLVN